MLKKGQYLKCECGSTTFKISILNSSVLLFSCADKECNKTIQLEVSANADNITKMITGFLSDKAKERIMDFIIRRQAGGKGE